MDRPISGAGIRIAFDRYEKRVALLDGDRTFTYGDLDRMSDNLALNLLELGLRPLDRVVVQLPNVAEFVILYLALQKIGAIPIAALVTHRFAEISQFVELSGAIACVMPDPQGDFDYLRDGRSHPPESFPRSNTASCLGRRVPAFCRSPT